MRENEVRGVPQRWIAAAQIMGEHFRESIAYTTATNLGAALKSSNIVQISIREALTARREGFVKDGLRGCTCSRPWRCAQADKCECKRAGVLCGPACHSYVFPQTHVGCCGNGSAAIAAYTVTATHPQHVYVCTTDNTCL